MRVVALTFGTEGDLRPMIALCRGLRDAGCDALLLGERSATDYAGQCGVPFVPLAGDMIRYGFTIRTRTGQRVDNVSIIAGSQLDAERRLRQMYVQCEILECRERSIPRRFEAANMHLIDLMAISPPTIQHHG